MKIGYSEMALHENQLDWLTLLNSMRIVSTDLISISKFIRDKKELMLKSCILVPKQFSEDVDPELKVKILKNLVLRKFLVNIVIS